MESVPEPLASRLSDFSAWSAWVEKAWDLDDQDDVVSTAMDWWFQREWTSRPCAVAADVASRR
jgi:hypothetical protein